MAAVPKAKPAPPPTMPSAVVALKGLFARYGLPASMATWAWSEVTAGRTQDEIMLDLRDRPEFQARFPAIKARQEAGLPPITPEEYLSYENTLSQHLSAAGLPGFMWQKGAYFSSAVSDLITANRSVDEVAQTIDKASNEVMNAPPEVRQAFTSLFGASGDQAIMSTFLDPKRAPAELQRMVAQADTMGTGARYGVQVNPNTLDEISRLGLQHSQIEQGMSQIAGEQGLFNERLGEHKDMTAGTTGVQAAFGLNGDAQQELQRRADERKASENPRSLGQEIGGKGVSGLQAADY